MTKEQFAFFVQSTLSESYAEIREWGKKNNMKEDAVNAICELHLHFSQNLFEKIYKRRTFERVNPKATLPHRSTVNSACYDFIAPYDISINADEVVIVRTGIRAIFPDNEALKIYVRSSIGIKKNLNLANGTGIIDADYYGNKENGGEILIALRNVSAEKVEIAAGDKFAQGMFLEYKVVDDDDVMDIRTGGVGSTGA